MEFYIYGAGAQMQRALNAVATFFTTNTFGSLVELALQVSFIIAATLFFLYRDSKHVLRFAFIYLAIPTFLISMKTTVQIIDKQNPMHSYSVDNVPYVVALPGWAATTFMNGLTEGVELVFTNPADRQYSTSGMIFGSNLYTLVRSTNTQTVALQRYWRHFYQSCILGDININRKYTMSQLMNAPDVLAFLGRHSMSPVRGVYNTQREYRTCKDAFPELEAQFQSEASLGINKLGAYILGRESSMQNTFLRNAIENSHQDLIGVSNNAVDILKQNMVINMTRWNIENNHNSIAANYAYTSNQMQTTTMWANIGLQAKEFIPMMHSIAIILFACFGTIVVILALLPHMTLPVLRNYFGSFFYLATWPMVFTILNAIMMLFLEQATQEASQGLRGITLSNMNGIDYVNTRYAAITGYLMMSTPALALALTKGASAMMSSLNYQLAGMINQTNARTSAAASTGDISHGNTQMQTHAFNTVSGNKYNTSTLFQQHGTTTQAPNGMLTTEYANNTVYDTNPTASNFQWQVATTRQYGEAVQDLHTDAQSNLSQRQAALNQSVQTGTALMADWRSTYAKTDHYGLTHGHGAVAQSQQGLEKVHQATEQVMQATGWNYDKSSAYLHATYNAVDGNIGVDTESLGKVAGLLSPLKAGINISTGQRWSDEDRETLSNTSSEQQSDLKAAIESYRSGVSQTVDASNRMSADERHSKAGSYAHAFSTNLNDTKAFSASVSQSQQEVDTLSHVNSQEERLQATLTEDLKVPFQNYVEKMYAKQPGEAQAILTGTTDEARQRRADEWEDFKGTDAFKNFVLSHVPTKEAHQEAFEREPTREEYLDMLTEHQRSQARARMARTTLKGHEKHGGTDAYYDGAQQEHIVNKAQESFEKTRDKVTP